MPIVVTDIENEEPIVTPQEQKKLIEYDPTDDNSETIVDDIRNAQFDVYKDLNFVSGSSGTSGTAGTSGTSGTAGTSGISGTAGTSSTSGTSGTGFKKNRPLKKGKKTPKPASIPVPKPMPVLTPQTLEDIEKLPLTPQQKTLIEKARALRDTPPPKGITDVWLPVYFKQLLPVVVNPPYNINTPGRLAHFCGQIQVETGWVSKSERMNYSEKRLTEVVKTGWYSYHIDEKTKQKVKVYNKPNWPGRLTDSELTTLSADKGNIKVNQIGGLADVIYGARTGNKGGNKYGTLDGWNYRGHGLIQITFKDPIYLLLMKLYPDEGFDKDTEKISTDPKWAVISALAWWLKAGADVLRDDVTDESIMSVSKRVNSLPTEKPARIKWTKEFYNKLK